MGKVYWNKPEIPIPPDAFRRLADHSVRINVTGSNGETHDKTIGYFTSETHMHPNDFFRLKYPVMWERFYGNDDLLPAELYLGMYAMTLGIGYRSTVYTMLHDVYGPEWGNALIDYSMYSILCESCVTQQFPEVMAERILFSRKMFSDSDYSDLFQAAKKDQHHQFRTLWLKHCKDTGIAKVWICIDGSNIDNEAKKSEYVEPGCPKSHNQKTIISFMYAVSSETGMPVYYLAYEGGTADCSKLSEMMDCLTGSDLKVEGVILDKGFCTDDVINYLKDKKIDYAIMMPSNCGGYQSTKDEFAATIRDKSRYSVNDDGVFGISKETKLFATHETTGIVNLYYDRVRGSIQSTKLHKEIRKEKKRLTDLIKKGKMAVVTPGMRKYFLIQQCESGEQELVIDYDAWDDDMVGKGYFAIVSSRDFGPEEVLRIYGLREASEVQYSILKSQEGMDTTRVHTTSGILSKFHCAFVSSIIRCEILLACKSLDYDTNVMIARIDRRIRVILSSPDAYTLSKAYRAEELKLLARFGISVDQLEEMAKSVAKRFGVEACSQVRRIPQTTNGDVQKRRGRGRPLGSKNKRTLQREAEESSRKIYEPEHTQVEKNKGGRPRGSKDKHPRTRRTKLEILQATSV